MEKYLPQINNLIKTCGISKYKNKLKPNKKNMNLLEINKLISNYHPNSKLIYLHNKNIVKEPRPNPILKYDNKKNIGYIKFFHFKGDNNIYTERDAKKIINLVKNKIDIWLEKKINKLIIDLTDYTGDYYKPFIESISTLLGNITLFAFVKNKQNFASPVWINLKNNKILDFPEVYRGSKIAFDGKIAILVSNNTCGEGEIFTSLFLGKSNDKIKIIGQNTSGKLNINNTFLIDKEEQLYLSLTTLVIQDTDLKVHWDEKIIPDIETLNFKESIKKAYQWLLQT